MGPPTAAAFAALAVYAAAVTAALAAPGSTYDTFKAAMAAPGATLATALGTAATSVPATISKGQ